MRAALIVHPKATGQMVDLFSASLIGSLSRGIILLRQLGAVRAYVI